MLLKSKDDFKANHNKDAFYTLLPYLPGYLCPLCIGNTEVLQLPSTSSFIQHRHQSDHLRQPAVYLPTARWLRLRSL